MSEALGMKVVLFYGDSNTCGHNTETRERFERNETWPSILQESLWSEYYVIEKGLLGRTTISDDPIEDGRNDKTYLLHCLMSHKPLDLVIIMLGTNDLKKRFYLPA